MALLACGGAYWPLAFEPSAMGLRTAAGICIAAGIPLPGGDPKCRGRGFWHKALVVGVLASALLRARTAAGIHLPGGDPKCRGRGFWHKALVVGSVSLWRRLLASRL